MRYATAAIIRRFRTGERVANYLRFRISPYSAIALAARVKRAGKDFVGDHQGLYPVEAQRGED